MKCWLFFQAILYKKIIYLINLYFKKRLCNREQFTFTLFYEILSPTTFQYTMSFSAINNEEKYMQLFANT